MFIFNFSCSCLFGTLNPDLVTCNYSPFLYYTNGTNMKTIKISTTQPPINILIDIGMINIMAVIYHPTTKRIFYAGNKSVGSSVIKELKLNGNIHRELMDCKYNGFKCYAFLNGKCKTFCMSEKRYRACFHINDMGTNLCICMYSNMYICIFCIFIHFHICIFVPLYTLYTLYTLHICIFV